MRLFTALLAVSLFGYPTTAQAAGHTSSKDAADILELIQSWVGGVYDNSAQVAADVANNVPDGKRVLPLHQFIEPVSLEAFGGLTFFSQLSNDGTTDTVLGVGIYQFFTDPESSQVVMRYHVFNEREPYLNAHLELSKLDGVSLDDVHANEGCQFYFSLSDDGSELTGAMKEDSCFPVSRATGQKIKHEDVLIIKPGEMWNDAKYYDLDGNLLFGNTSGDYQKQVRLSP